MLKSHLFLPEDLHLYDLPQIFAASATWLEAGLADYEATFDLFIRDLPEARNFLLFGGLEEIIDGIKNWGYTSEEVDYLRKGQIITDRLADYLRSYRFSGSLWALREGTVFFAGGEPVVRVTAPIIEGNLITMFLMNVVTGNTKFLSKVIRCVIAAQPKACLGVAGLRAESFESAAKCARAAYIAGAMGSNSVPAVARKFELPAIQPLTVAYHALIQSFPTELEAMRTMAFLYQGRVSLMVDTYDFEQGLRNAITVAKELKSKGRSLYGIMLDSGDLRQQCLRARRRLDTEDLPDVKITLASNLDEYKIQQLNKQKVPADAYLIATEAISVPDAPKLETVYKLTELRKGNNVINLVKLATGKVSYPGRKQVFRVRKGGRFSKDIIGLEDENLGEPLLIEVIRDGEVIYHPPTLDEMREYVSSQLNQLPSALLSLNRRHRFPIQVSGTLKKLFITSRRRVLSGEHSLDEPS